MTLKTYATANAPFSAKKSPSRIPHSTIMVESGGADGRFRRRAAALYRALCACDSYDPAPYRRITESLRIS